MRMSVVVKASCMGYGRNDVPDACKVHIFREFAFHSNVNALCLGVVFGIPGFSHAVMDMPVILTISANKSRRTGLFS